MKVTDYVDYLERLKHISLYDIESLSTFEDYINYSILSERKTIDGFFITISDKILGILSNNYKGLQRTTYKSYYYHCFNNRVFTTPNSKVNVSIISPDNNLTVSPNSDISESDNLGFCPTFIKYIKVPSTVYCLVNNDLFKFNKIIEGIDLGETKVINYGADLFYECSNLKKVILPPKIRRLHIGTFYSCTSLEEIDIPERVKVIEEKVFENCINLKRVGIHINLTEIDSHAFVNCSSLEELDLPGVKNIIYTSFVGCTKLRHINFGNPNVIINRYAFDDCPNLDLETRIFINKHSN